MLGQLWVNNFQVCSCVTQIGEPLLKQHGFFLLVLRAPFEQLVASSMRNLSVGEPWAMGLLHFTATMLGAVRSGTP